MIEFTTSRASKKRTALASTLTAALGAALGAAHFLSSAAPLTAQSLDATPPSLCGKPRALAAAGDSIADSRVLIRFSPATASSMDDALLARALGTLVSDRVRGALDVDVRSRGLGATPALTNAASAVAEGRVLGVRYVLVGSVRRETDRVQVAWRMVDARSGAERGSGVVSQPAQGVDSLVGTFTTTLTRAFARPPYVAPAIDRVRSASAPALAAFVEALTDLEAFDRANLAKADTALRRALAADPAFVAARFRAAQLSLRMLEWIEQRDAERRAYVSAGLRSVGLALQANPYDPRALALLGRLYLHSATPELAQPVLRALKRLAPTDPSTVTLEAHVLRAQGHDADALRVARAPTPAVARSVDALMIRADLERRVGDPVNACRVLNQAITLDPLFAPAYVWRAVVRSPLGERREGWADAEVATRLGRKDWGELTSALIDISVADTVRARTRSTAYMQDAALRDGGWTDLLLRAAVANGLKSADKVGRALRQVACGDPRRPQLAREPLLRAVPLPNECSGARMAATPAPARRGG